MLLVFKFESLENVQNYPIWEIHSQIENFYWASLSEPHISLTSLHPCVCMFACLLACLLVPTTYRKSLPALILRGYVIR